MKVIYKKDFKILNGNDVNYIFNMKTGFNVTFGKTLEDDPEYSPYGAFIADIELSTVCNAKCKFCYKSNTSNGINMSFDTYKKVFHNINDLDILTQIAFGIGDIDSNKDLELILDYTRKNRVIPNITINGFRMTEHYYDMLAKYCGAVAVSCYDYNSCYNAIKELHNRGMNQLNIHQVLAKESLDKCYKLVDDASTGKIVGLNAIVFLWLKPKGDRNTWNEVSQDEFSTLVKYALDKKVSIGFDSCSAPMFAKAVNYDPKMMVMIEPCESLMMSAYVNAKGVMYPCSFAEGLKEYCGVDMKVNKISDVWDSHPEIVQFRKDSLASKDAGGCRNCTIYKLGHCGKST
jgi:radical SAM protein with 4Fe4S-binding SPASM domain